jgi:hypothetical protein
MRDWLEDYYEVRKIERDVFVPAHTEHVVEYARA